MAYQFEDAIAKINEEKKKWDTADKAGDTEGKKAASKAAQPYYDFLRKNGYSTVANNLASRGYNDSIKYANAYFTKTGRSPIRSYFKEKAKNWGISEADIDKMITWDGDTGEVYFAGKSIGRPDGIVDNTSYFKPEYLDKVWDNHIAENGINRSDKQLSGINSEGVLKKTNELYDIQKDDRKIILDKTGKLEDYNYNHNPYETEIGKSIMDDYKYMGDVASGDAIADGAGSNSGNIDSFSAANAARQQLAFTNAGKEAVLADFNARISNARGILSDLGVWLGDNQGRMQDTIGIQQGEAQRLFENDQTEKLNAQDVENQKVDNLVKKSAVTGYIPSEWTENPYLNDDGTLKNVNIDYNARIKEYENALNNATSEDEKKAIRKNLEWLEQAWNKKIVLPEYSKFAGDRTNKYYNREENAETRLTKEQLDNAFKMANMENNTNVTLANIDAISAVDQINANAQAQKDVLEKEAELNKQPETNIYTSDRMKSALENINKGLKGIYGAGKITLGVWDGKPFISGGDGVTDTDIINTVMLNNNLMDNEKIDLLNAIGIGTDRIEEEMSRKTFFSNDNAMNFGK